MADRLTDRTEKVSGFDTNDIGHVVDTNDTSQNAAGSSFWFRWINMFGELGARRILGCLVLKANPSTNNNNIQSNDWVFWMEGGSENRLIIGIATDTIASVPADLDDPAKFDKYFEGSKLLP